MFGPMWVWLWSSWLSCYHWPCWYTAGRGLLKTKVRQQETHTQLPNSHRKMTFLTACCFFACKTNCSLVVLFRTSYGNRVRFCLTGEFRYILDLKASLVLIKLFDINTNPSSPVGQPSVREYQGGQTEQISSCGNLFNLHLRQIYQTKWNQRQLQLCHCSHLSKYSKRKRL